MKQASATSVNRIMDKNDQKKIMPGTVGVGSPFIVHDPDTFQKWMVYTAWKDKHGNRREIWKVPIDKELNIDIDNAEKLADGSTGSFDVDGLNTVTFFWDDFNEEWVFACTAYGAPKTSYGYFIFFDQDWNLKDTQTIDFEYTTNGTRVTPSLGDAGIGMVPLADKSLVLSGGFGKDRSLFTINDYTSRPLDLKAAGNSSDGNSWCVVSSYHLKSMDVHQLFEYNNRLVMLSELVGFTGSWGITVNFGPERDWFKVENTNMVGKFMMPCPITWGYGCANYTHLVPNQLMHPHYTSLLGKPLLFFIACPTWNAEGKRAYAHEIWAQEINPEIAFEPRKNLPLVICGTNEPFNIGKIPFPTFGANKAEIEIYNAASNGNITLKESTSPYNIWKENARRYISDHSIKKGSNKIAVDNPSPYMALATDVKISEWAAILR